MNKIIYAVCFSIATAIFVGLRLAGFFLGAISVVILYLAAYGVARSLCAFLTKKRYEREMEEILQEEQQ